MARKKSATKKAKEAELKNATPVEREEAAAVVAEKKKKVKAVTPEESSSSDDDESSEDEDEYGELITESVEQGINKVLDAIKTDPSKLLDPNVKFFEEEQEDDKAKLSKKTDKPIYLKDYHRMNLLSGGFKEEDEEEEGNEFGTVDGEKPFVVTEREERNKLLEDIKGAFETGEGSDDDGSDDDFLKKKESKPQSRREIIDETSLPDPNKDSSEFLSAFVDKQAWIPKANDKVINLDRIDDDAEEEFDDAVEKFEHAYNFRYEDANSAEIVSYARNQATLRRSATNSRKRQRERDHEEREKEEKEKQELLKKKKTSKVNEVADRLSKIKEAVGGEVSDEVIQKVFGDSLLNDDFDDEDWDNKMAQIFDEQYYGEEQGKPEFSDDEQKPEWSDDDKEVSEDDKEEESVTPVVSSKKEKLQKKKNAKKSKESIKEKAQEIVEANTLKLLSEVVEERGRSKKKDNDELKFKYREVSPETFGLSTRDIIMADDKQLNNYIGLKKFAPYRAKELRMKDKRKYTKKKHLKDWQKETFRGMPKAPEDDGDENNIWIPIEGGAVEEVKDKKHKKDKKKKSKGRK
ncbi:protein Kri1p [[Candida] anglica]|uniref:Protein Kri1p n=1 Tax=[Candida] anglica TaxID=148631 RepID=A0ABP0EBU2_9ASCO